MPRDGTQTYILPFPDVVADTTIESPVYNGFTNDVAQDLNAPRPITSGGTGATSAAGALAALGGETASQVVTNYDSYVFKAGSFYSAAGATGAPNAHAFSGICYLSDASNIVIEARDASDGKPYIRRKVAGVWGAWTFDSDLSGINADIALKVAKAGDTMTGMLVLPATEPTLATHATNKAFVDTKADIASPTFTGNPQAPTPTAGDSDTSLATTAFVQAAIVSSIKTVKVQKFVANGTYTPSAGMLYCIIECQAPGGGGGGISANVGRNDGGGGGGGGSYSRLWASAATIGASKAVTIAAAGVGGVGGVSHGTAGGDASLGSLCIGKGGAGGLNGSSGNLGSGGAGGVAGTGDFTQAGGSGSDASIGTVIAQTLPSGTGGNAVLGNGGGGITSFTTAVGRAGSGYGGGGGGAIGFNVTATANGGAGGAGIVIVTEYCSQ